MKPKYFTDTHIDKEAIRQLRVKGLDVIRCEDVSLEKASDKILLDYATQQERVMLSCDRDFEDLHYAWVAEEKRHAGIILMSQKRHCQHRSEIVRIVMFYHNLADSENDLQASLWLGDDAQ